MTTEATVLGGATGNEYLLLLSCGRCGDGEFRLDTCLVGVLVGVVC